MSRSTSPAPAPDPTPSAPPTCGVMTITLLDNGTSRPTPSIAFSPVGRFTPGMMHDYLTHFAHAIDRAQSEVRHEHAKQLRLAGVTP